MTQNIGTLLLPGPPLHPLNVPPWSDQEHLIKLFQSFRRSGNCQWKRTAWQGRRQPHKNPFQNRIQTFGPAATRFASLRTPDKDLFRGRARVPERWTMCHTLDSALLSGYFRAIELDYWPHRDLQMPGIMAFRRGFFPLMENPEMRWENNNSGKFLQAVC